MLRNTYVGQRDRDSLSIAAEQEDSIGHVQLIKWQYRKC